jgi:hypothetical protein
MLVRRNTRRKAKYLFLSSHLNVGHNLNIKLDNRLFENATDFKYFGTRPTILNLVAGGNK